MLRSNVWRDPCAAHKGIYRTDIDDCTTIPSLDHRFGLILHAKERPFQIAAHHLVPWLLRTIDDRRYLALETSTVHGEIEPAECFHCLSHHSFHLARDGDIRLPEYHSPAPGFDIRHEGCQFVGPARRAAPPRPTRTSGSSVPMTTSVGLTPRGSAPCSGRSHSDRM